MLRAAHLTPFIVEEEQIYFELPVNNWAPTLSSAPPTEAAHLIFLYSGFFYSWVTSHDHKWDSQVWVRLDNIFENKTYFLFHGKDLARICTDVKFSRELIKCTAKCTKRKK